MSLFSGVASIASNIPGGGATMGAASLNPALALGFADSAQNAYFNYKNYQLQKSTFDYQKDMQAISWAREDNAVSRRVADLKRAGLSPVLAAGSAASSSSPIAMSAPQIQSVNMSEKAMFVMSMLKMENEIHNTIAQRDLIKAQTYKDMAEAGIKAHDLSIYEKSGMASNAHGIAKDIRDILGLLGTSPSETIKKVQGTIDKTKLFLNNPFLFQKQKNEEWFLHNDTITDKNGKKLTKEQKAKLLQEGINR